MRKEPPAEIVEIFSKLAENMGAEYFTISTPIICDNCKDDNEEAFPYYVKDRDGREWAHLCNECFDDLGCVIEHDDIEKYQAAIDWVLNLYPHLEDGINSIINEEYDE